MNQHKFEICEYEVEPANGRATVRVVYMSDFHVGPHTPQSVMDSAMTACQAQRPDVILLGGDFISSKAQLSYLPGLATAFATLQARFGVYYVLGNHDYWSGPEVVAAAFDAIGLINITNRNVLLTDDIHLCGLDDSWEGKPDIPAAFTGAESGRRLVLTHNPKLFKDFHDRDCVAILGHTHGGQLLIPFLPNPAWLFGKGPYIKGWYSAGNSRIYVNRGLGMSILPLRLNCPPEITVLTLPVG